MADQNDPKTPNHQPDGDRPEDYLHSDVPVEEEPLEESEATQPRRAASAEFVVDAEVGSEAALRAAMDPATQSLADALRLSFRLLQFVILVLVVLFFASGLQTVDEGESGVMVRWGKIVPVAGHESLEPGLHFSLWPYPIGEFIIFDAENLSASTGTFYWPNLRGRSLEQASESAAAERIIPDPLGRHGYVLTADGDMGHIQVNAQYRIEQPAEFVQRFAIADAQELVHMALRRATVLASAKHRLHTLADATEEIRHDIQQSAQRLLDDVQSGIRLTSISIPDSTVPLAVRNTFNELQNARLQAEERIERSRLRANQHLIDAAGERHRTAIRLIDRYEQAVVEGDEERAEAELANLFSLFDSGELSGEVAQIIQHASAYRSQIDTSLGNEARRFTSLLPAFRQHPEFVVRERWMNVYANILSREDAELIFVPHHVGHVNLALSGLHSVKEKRQQRQLDRREQQAMMQFYGRQRPGQYIPFVSDERDGPGRQLTVDEEGRVRGMGDRR